MQKIILKAGIFINLRKINKFMKNIKKKVFHIIWVYFLKKRKNC